jgi:hypothetical protein
MAGAISIDSDDDAADVIVCEDAVCKASKPTMPECSEPAKKKARQEKPIERTGVVPDSQKSCQAEASGEPRYGTVLEDARASANGVIAEPAAKQSPVPQKISFEQNALPLSSGLSQASDASAMPCADEHELEKMALAMAEKALEKVQLSEAERTEKILKTKLGILKRLKQVRSEATRKDAHKGIIDIIVNISRDSNGHAGFTFDPDRLTVLEVKHERPELSTVRAGDIIKAINGKSVTCERDYDREARGTPHFALTLQRVEAPPPPPPNRNQSEDELAFDLGTSVEVFGLTSETGKQLNGKVGVILMIDRMKGRYHVKLPKDNDPKSIKPENLRCEPAVKRSRSDDIARIVELLDENDNELQEFFASLLERQEDDCFENVSVPLETEDRRPERPGERRMDEASAPNCTRGHQMVWSDYAEGGYSKGWSCDNSRHCNGDMKTCGPYRWLCQECSSDICPICTPNTRQQAFEAKEKAKREAEREADRAKRKAFWNKSEDKLKRDEYGKLTANDWESSQFNSSMQKDKFLRLMGGEKFKAAVEAGSDDDDSDDVICAEEDDVNVICADDDVTCDDGDIPTDVPTFELSGRGWVEANHEKHRAAELEKLYSQGLEQGFNPRRGLGSY